MIINLSPFHKILICFFFLAPLEVIQSQSLTGNVNPPEFQDPETLVQLLYDQVTFPPNATPDWELVKTMFVKEAVIFLRTGREKTNQFTVEEWVQDFVNFIDNAKVIETGFEEKILKINTTVFRDIAQCWVLYKAKIPSKGRSNEGVDSFHLIRKEGRWWIASILNEIPTPDRPAPDVW